VELPVYAEWFTRDRPAAKDAIEETSQRATQPASLQADERPAGPMALHPGCRRLDFTSRGDDDFPRQLLRSRNRGAIQTTTQTKYGEWPEVT
jgi:hypothetical protein